MSIQNDKPTYRLLANKYNVTPQFVYLAVHDKCTSELALKIKSEYGSLLMQHGANIAAAARRQAA